MSRDDLKATFFAECEDLLDQLSEGTGELEAGTATEETVHAIFRAVHSIKGAAGAFALDTLVKFAHRFETVLDRLRSGSLVLDPDALQTILRSGDMLAELVELAQAESDEEPSQMAELIELLVGLSGSEEDGPGAPEPDEAFEFTAVSFMPLSFDEPGEDAEDVYKIRVPAIADLFRNGHDPFLLFAELVGLGQLDVSCDASALPVSDEFDPNRCYLSWELTLTGSMTEVSIRDAFVFLDDICEIEQVSGGSAGPALDLPGIEPEDSPMTTAEPSNPSMPQVAAEEAAAEPAAVASSTSEPAAAEKSKAAKPAASIPQTTLRVDPERVDRLINTVGELIINQAVITQKLVASGMASNSDIMSDLDDYQYLARELQEGVMAIRAQPVKPLFQRMQRIVREAAYSLGKDVALVTEGEATEIDKTLVERLAEPLTHMIRNAVDHGIEGPEKRAAAGKSAQGTIKLSAAHCSGDVLIEISDDGAGLNRKRILEKAVSQGMVAADAKMADSEIDNLLFMAGFSTAEKVTNLSGRGVGMDVVKTAITSLGGRISISSRQGMGTKFSIALPLTLAVMDGMVIHAGGETLVAPLSSVVETIRPKPKDILPFGRDGRLLSIRGTYVPIVNLARLLGFPTEAEITSDNILILIRSEQSGLVALAVDDISDQRQVVIKSLEGNYGAIEGISAATILGDGRIALIIDTDAILSLAGHYGREMASREEMDYAQTATMG
ncbi:chemotaxis protein CheA [Rhodovulum sulfidophilum]|uniref:Chemotaxis protein CheA n=1 Tax=Rhodovulum visakhapatnamense TaxID=364297 RepID=A0ABS1RE89_9RHOB|nr:chemotaxis protein CheA [Rhodovulum visakhapatnamense]MBL3568044.1 chemotaxis protein CheA [Rhodovulum visakhapatnamense]MBL3577933.1 chemotaxis protein CheA [Rhodovulum visakhapatnamense]OLS46233.1 chemotaxis protein CheA [Rhodovulum sulfidophilum]